MCKTTINRRQIKIKIINLIIKVCSSVHFSFQKKINYPMCCKCSEYKV